MRTVGVEVYPPKSTCLGKGCCSVVLFVLVYKLCPNVCTDYITGVFGSTSPCGRENLVSYVVI